MDKKRIVAWKNLPMRAPVFLILFAYLCMDYWAAPGWVHGIVWTVLGLYTIGYIHEVFTKEDIEL